VEDEATLRSAIGRYLQRLGYEVEAVGRGDEALALVDQRTFDIVLLDESGHVPARPTLRRLLAAALIAPAVTVVVMLVFEKLFLVRLP
jgi:DNA-binding response OmpR family regulator